MNTNEFIKYESRFKIYQLLYLGLILEIIVIIFLYLQVCGNKIYNKNVQERSYNDRVESK